MFKRKILLPVLVMALSVSLAACEMTGVYDEARSANDSTFAASIIRVCGLTAVLASERQLTAAEQMKLKELCLLVDARKLEELRKVNNGS